MRSADPLSAATANGVGALPPMRVGVFVGAEAVSQSGENTIGGPTPKPKKPTLTGMKTRIGRP